MDQHNSQHRDQRDVQLPDRSATRRSGWVQLAIVLVLLAVGLPALCQDITAAPAQAPATQPGAPPPERSDDGGITLKFVAVSLLKGFGVTMAIAASSIVLGFLASIPVGALLHRGRGVSYFLARGVVDFLRGTPVLIQLYFVYYAPSSFSTALSLTPIAAAIVTLSINSMAYMSEVVRSGLMSVDPGQKLAGRALGFSRLQVFRLIVWPQAFRIALPPLMNSVVALIKDTALVSVISVSEVILRAKSIISITFDPAKYYLIVAVMFFVVTFPLMKLAGLLESRIKQKGFAA